MLNYVNVTFPKSDLPPQRVYSLTLTQVRYGHEMVEVMFRDWDTRYLSIRPMTPVQVEIRSTSGSRKFHGYVYNISPDISPGKNFVKMTLIGSSYMLRQARQKVYGGASATVTAGEIVAELCGNASLSHSIVGQNRETDNPRKYEQVAQAGHTDLELMTRLAIQNGYTLRFEDLTVCFEPLGYYFDKFKSSAPRFSMRSANNPQGSTLYSFSADINDSMIYGDSYKAAIRVAGVSASEGVSYTYTATTPASKTRLISQAEFFDGFATKVVAPNLDTATREAQAAESMNKYPYRAIATVIGTPTLKPDSPIYLEGIGDEYSGYWTVLAVKHTLFEEKRNVFTYVTSISIGTDSLGVVSSAVLSTVNPGTTTLETSSKEDSGNSVRTLIPNSQNTTVSPDASLFSTLPAPNLVTQEVGGVATNRAQPQSAKVEFRKPQWVSNYRDINNITPTDNKMPGHIRKRLGRD